MAAYEPAVVVTQHFTKIEKAKLMTLRNSVFLRDSILCHCPLCAGRMGKINTFVLAYGLAGNEVIWQACATSKRRDFDENFLMAIATLEPS